MGATAAGAELRRALGVNFVTLGAPVIFESLTSRPWASITFAGERHKLTLCLPGPGAFQKGSFPCSPGAGVTIT